MKQYLKTWPKVPGLPSGVELVRVGTPMLGELYITHTGEVAQCHEENSPLQGMVIVYKPRGWRYVRYKDTYKIPFVARFREKHGEPWLHGMCVKYNPIMTYKWLDQWGVWHKRCQIYTGEDLPEILSVRYFTTTTTSPPS